MVLNKYAFVTTFILCVFYLIQCLTGCTVVEALKGESVTDVFSIVKPGMSRADVEETIGPPLVQWTPKSDICYCVYNYEVKTHLGDRAGDAIYRAVLDIYYLGLPELMGLFDDRSDKHKIFKRFTVSYDLSGKVIEVFDHVVEFEEPTSPHEIGPN